MCGLLSDVSSVIRAKFWMTSHVFGLPDGIVEQVLGQVPVYSSSFDGYEETDQAYVQAAIHHYYYPVATTLVKRFSEVGYVPFYQLNEIVANVLLHIFEHRHPSAAYHAAVWNFCIAKQFHTTVYC